MSGCNKEARQWRASCPITRRTPRIRKESRTRRPKIHLRILPEILTGIPRPLDLIALNDLKRRNRRTAERLAMKIGIVEIGEHDDPRSCFENARDANVVPPRFNESDPSEIHLFFAENCSEDRERAARSRKCPAWLGL